MYESIILVEGFVLYEIFHSHAEIFQTTEHYKNMLSLLKETKYQNISGQYTIVEFYGRILSKSKAGKNCLV